MQAPAFARCRVNMNIPEEQRAATIFPKYLYLSGTVLADSLLMTHLSQTFLPLVCRHFMTLTFFAAGHLVFTSFEDVIYFLQEMNAVESSSANALRCRLSNQSQSFFRTIFGPVGYSVPAGSRCRD